jgi:uncharacterized membrane protein (DUF4010 family)
MLIRNVVILGLLAPRALLQSADALVLMLAGAALVALLYGDGAPLRRRAFKAGDPEHQAPVPAMPSPFSLTAALKFGILMLALQVAGTLAQRALGDTGFYAVSVVGGVVSSASATAAAATLAATGTLEPRVAGGGAILASLMSALVNLPIVARMTKDRVLTRRLTAVLAGVILLGVIGAVVQARFVPIPDSWLASPAERLP